MSTVNTSSIVHTIRGPIDSADLGRTLSHEHLTGGAAAMERVRPAIYDEDEAVRRAIEALRRAKAAGVDSMIDLTPLDLGRQASLFQRVAEADTGVHIVCATGVYRWVPFYLFRRDIDEVAAIFLHDIEHGIDGTDIKAGIIKLAWDFEYQLTAEGAAGEGMARAGLERTARAAARAAKAGGVPISCHTNAAMELGTPLMALFEDEGVDPAMVTIGHTNDSHNLDYILSIAKRGFNVGLDRFSAAHRSRSTSRRRATPARPRSATTRPRTTGLPRTSPRTPTAGPRSAPSRSPGSSPTAPPRPTCTRCRPAASAGRLRRRRKRGAKGLPAHATAFRRRLTRTSSSHPSAAAT